MLVSTFLGAMSKDIADCRVEIDSCRLLCLQIAGFGLRRMLRDSTGHGKGILSHGEQKSIQTDRVILVPGPADEVAITRDIYHMFVQRKLNESSIASLLNQRGVRRDAMHQWTRGTVHEILTNEKYIGNNVYNKESSN